MKKLEIAKELSLPLEAVTQAIGLVGQRGSGKTHTLAVIAEELIGVGAPVAILDPLGVLWGLRSSSDGKKAGLPVVILGGEHGDVPIESTAGKVIADWVISERRPCVIDASAFRKAEQRRFVTDFALALYARNRDPLHLVVDEADLFIPQRPGKDELTMLGAFEDLIRRGRARGIGITIATQRPAVVHKDALTQVGALLAHRLVGPQDRDAIEAWIKYHGDKEGRDKVLGSLGSLPVGTAWFWSPGWLGILKKVQIRERTTFDSSSTPKLGAERFTPKALAPVELDALRGKIAETIERARQDDPKALRKRIADLERELAKKPEAIVEKRIVDRFILDEAGLGMLHEALSEHLGAIAKQASDSRGTLGQLINEYRDRCRKIAAANPKIERIDVPSIKKIKLSNARRPTNGAPSFTKAERALLTAWAQSTRPLTVIQAAIIAGYSPTSGGVGSAVASLRSRGLLDGTRITQAGRDELGEYEELPTGRDLAEYWYQQLGKAEAEILRVVVDVYPKSITTTDAALRCGYSPTSGGVGGAVAKLRKLELVHGGGSGMVADERLV